ncbi:MAG TPA: aldo/keto reductase [Jatrophihabitans sp.]|nr:aldo/keto reductase [Jatrophihabitans sp.]
MSRCSTPPTLTVRGTGERLLGEILEHDADVRIATKFGNTIDESTRQLTGVDVSAGYVRSAVTASLRRLRRQRVDLYQLHTPDVTPAQGDDLIEVLEELVIEGAIAGGASAPTTPRSRAGCFGTALHRAAT